MRESIRKQLVDLNRRLYTEWAQEFSNSRSYYWDGWEKMLELIGEELPQKLSILDLGCGNGRFGSFMKERGYEIDYTGVDNSKELLKITEKTLQVSGIEVDLSTDYKILSGTYDLIVLFGVLHHIPGMKQRGELLMKVAKLLSENGTVVFTTWNFYRDERLSKRIIDPSVVGLNGGELEDGDHILRWERGTSTVRYVHSFSEAEVTSLIASSGLELRNRFEADGKIGTLNSYYVLN